MIYDLLQNKQQVDNILRNDVSRRRLCAKQEGDRPCRLLAALDLQIFVDDIKGVHLLALILMKTLYLDIKYGIRI